MPEWIRSSPVARRAEPEQELLSRAEGVMIDHGLVQEFLLKSGKQ